MYLITAPLVGAIPEFTYSTERAAQRAMKQQETRNDPRHLNHAVLLFRIVLDASLIHVSPPPSYPHNAQLGLSSSFNTATEDRHGDVAAAGAEGAAGDDNERPKQPHHVGHPAGAAGVVVAADVADADDVDDANATAAPTGDLCGRLFAGCE